MRLLGPVLRMLERKRLSSRALNEGGVIGPNGGSNSMERPHQQGWQRNVDSSGRGAAGLTMNGEGEGARCHGQQASSKSGCEYERVEGAAKT